MSGLPSTVEWAWRPQLGPQKALVDCPLAEILFGGARGGGKTDGILGKYALKEARYGEAFNAVFFRKEMPQQDDLIERAKDIYLRLPGARWIESRKTFRLPRGGRIRFRPLENVKDAEKYQGQNVTDAAVEEAGNYAQSTPIDMLFGCLRSKHGVPIQLILTANPGGPGHHWLKSRYVDPAPLGMHVLERDLPDHSVHRYVYIPSRVEHNQILLANDPGYVSRLYLVGSETLVRAWLAGDWDVVAGAFFDVWDKHRHVIPAFTPPMNWPRFAALDWGSAKPFSWGLYAVADGNVAFSKEHKYGGLMIPRGALVRFRELYGMQPGQPNVGLKWHAGRVAQEIRAFTGKDAPKYTAGDPAMFKEDGGPSIAETFRKSGVPLRKADNRRDPGWDQVRFRLQGDHGVQHPPMLLITENCRELIRTLPALQHDRLKAEDVDTDQEDHGPDELRYGCMSRPRARPVPKDRMSGKPKRGTFEWLVQETGGEKPRSIYRT